MINPPRMALLCLALTLAAMPLSAQTTPAKKSQSPPAGSVGTVKKAAAAPQATTTDKPAANSTDAAKGKNSPFDYRSSEQISEDVPVSFPVDI